MIAERNKAVFTQPPESVPDGNVDVSGGGRWKIWQNAGTKIDAPILGNGDLLAAVAGDGQEMQGIRSSGLLQMISGRWKVQRTGNFFMITTLPNVILL